jgi:hypothetical protein
MPYLNLGGRYPLMSFHSHKTLINWLGGLTFIIIIAVPAYSQRKDWNVYDAGNIPRSLQSRLRARLDLLVEYHKTKQWDKLSAMRGDFYGGYNRKRYTPADKRKVIEQQGSNRQWLNFTLEKITFSASTVALSLRKRWWYIEGSAEYLIDGKAVQRHIRFIVYFHDGQWFFSPPD